METVRRKMKLRKILRYELSMIYNSMGYNLKIYRNKLGLNWAKLSSNWNWGLL